MLEGQTRTVMTISIKISVVCAMGGSLGHNGVHGPMGDSHGRKMTGWLG